MNINASFFKPLTLVSFILLGFNVLFISSSFAQVSDTQVEEKEILKRYDVEIILFKNIKVPKASEKILPSQAPFLDEQFISFVNAEHIEAATEFDFIVPEKNEFRLLDIAHKIKTSSRYKLLTHMTWRQPGLATNDALSVQIRTGEKFGNDFSSIDNPVIPFKETIEDEETEKGEFKTLKLSDKISVETNDIEKVWYELEGKVTITLARYLHAYVDLVLRVPNENNIQVNTNFETSEQIDKQSDFALSSVTLNNFSFKEHRRMRSRKLHFLDHPEVGMLILITPYEEPENIEFIEEDLNLG